MKKLFLFCMVISSSMLFAQASYFPSGMVWKSDYQTFCGEGSEDGWQSDISEIRVEGDTLINGIVYQLIGGCPVRAEGKQIYCRIKPDGVTETDVLLYDFGLEVGGKITQNYYESQSPDYATVTAVDYVTLLDGTQAKRLYYNNRGMDIEYIGAVSQGSSGLFSPLSNLMPSCARWRFLCCSADGEPLYEATPGGCTASVIDALEQVGARQLSVSPNPVRDYLELQGLEQEVAVAIYDLSGQCLLRTASRRIDVSALPAGIYLLHALAADGKHYQAKFVKE